MQCIVGCAALLNKTLRARSPASKHANFRLLPTLSISFDLKVFRDPWIFEPTMWPVNLFQLWNEIVNVASKI